MKNENEKICNFDEPPYVMEKTACGINSVIEVLELPIDKLKDFNKNSIAEKLKELSSRHYQNFIEVEDQSRLLQDIIDYKCKDERQKERIMHFTMTKYVHLLKTNKLI